MEQKKDTLSALEIAPGQYPKQVKMLLIPNIKTNLLFRP